MEDYLASELKEGQYDLFANLAILKLFVYGFIDFKWKPGALSLG